MPIKLLDPQVVARIAAGEVVERPASVVKELVENALDAGATQVTVEAAGGGISLIRVTDNGVGIPANEVELAFQRHATSKIASLVDLESISTLGFRGEALASLIAVGEVELATCAAGETAGSYLHLVDGEIVDRTPQGRSRGTTITVRGLFHNVPARLKFLKSTATEGGHIAAVVTHYALAYPEVRFTLSVDRRTTLSTPGNGRLIDCVVEVYGADTARGMIELRRDNSWDGAGQDTVAVTGLVGSPAVSRSNRNYLSCFVNRRWVNSRLLTWALEEAYHGLLMTGKHPAAVLNISIPPGEVDVNIHPAKMEVKFRDERRVFAAVQRLVRRALIEPVSLPRIEDPAATYAAPTSSLSTRPLPAEKVERPSGLPLARPVPAFALPALRPLGQVAGCYIVAEGPDGLYLIDQHAAHERVLFEQIVGQRAQRQLEVQGLLEPQTFEVSPAQNAALLSRLDELAGFGFTLEPFGERAYLVRAVPAFLNRKDWMAVLREIADSPGGGEDWSERTTASIACHSAVRAGQTLGDDEMRALLRQLEQTALPSTCPHGRPTMLHLNSAYLEREFGRRG
ncbi:MAG: DNA mismatch repair endonuclease MutL [Chloroflexi bacterium]|nr:DNA mismatch repair endonuclease MutL [Chloroflexota bacterium]